MADKRHDIKPTLFKKIYKLSKKDKATYSALLKKIEEIISCEDVNKYKNLKYDFKNLKRVHIGHFVLVFSYDEEQNLIIFEDFEHHDKIYKR